MTRAAAGRLIVTHFAGPSWQTKDGSTVVGTVEAKVTVDPTAIQWLRLKAVYIQRIATTGGLSPAAADCNTGTLGAVKEVPYPADYVLWKRAGHCGPGRKTSQGEAPARVRRTARR